MKTIKTIAITLLVLTLSMIGYHLQQRLVAKYQFEKDYGFAWNLAYKSSTIEAKAGYIAQFIGLMESNKTDFSAHNAKWMTTPDNSFEMNLAALKTLNSRLQEVMKMDVKSFEYQTAIQQITQQEQGEADQLIGAIYGCWLKEKHPVVWTWYQNVWSVVELVMGFATLLMLALAFG
jgi:hypothetical protein